LLTYSAQVASLVPVLVLVGVLAFLLAAIAQAVTGFGSALVSVPLLAVVVGPVDAVVAATLAGLLLTAGAWRREREYADRPRVRLFAVTGLIGMPLGLLLLAVLPERTLTLFIASTVLLLVVLLAAGARLPTAGPAQATAGLVSGALLTSTGMNGPPLVIALHDLEPRRFRGTLQATFCLQDAAAVVGFAALGHLSADAVALAAAGLVGLPLGWAVGDRMFRRVPAERFRWLVLGGLTASALGALVSAR
jgi:uncharacterized membrane protein YfcA